MPLFKAFKAPNATISINIGKHNFVLGETITGNVLVTSEEEFEAKEIRVKLQCAVKRTVVGMVDEEGREDKLTPYIFKKIKGRDYWELPIYNGQTKVSEKLKITKGYSQQFPFQIIIPEPFQITILGPLGMLYARRSETAWTLKGVVAVGGRPTVETKKNIKVSIQKNQS